jgi:hypothetical protein
MLHAREIVKVNDYEAWQRSIFAGTIAGHKLAHLYYWSLIEIINVFQCVPESERTPLIKKYIRIVTAITQAANADGAGGQQRLWMLAQALDHTYQLMLPESKKSNES